MTGSAASMTAEHAPKKRASTPRSRNGCLTWTRRIKCDEGQPECLKCISSSWKCEGYAKNQKPALRSLILPKPNGKQTLPRPGRVGLQAIASASPSDQSVITPNPSKHLFQTEEEHKYFRYFQEHTVKELSGLFNTNVWGQLVLQACHKEHFVKHAVLAISALNTSLQGSSKWTPDDETTQPSSQLISPSEHHRKVALREYSKALQLMRKATPLDEDDAIRNMLLACLLTICFENMHGSISSSIAQSQVGAKLLNQWIEKEANKGAKIQSRISPRPGAIESDLLAAFARMDLHFTLVAFENIDLSNGILTMIQRDLDALQGTPKLFVSIDQARYYFELISRLTTTKNHLIEKKNAKVVSADGISDIVVVPILNQGDSQEATSKYALKFEDETVMRERVYSAFEPLLKYSQTPEGSAAFLPATLLLVHWTSLPFVSRSHYLSCDEIWYDKQLPAMQTCNRLLRQILELETGNEKLPRKPKFAFEAHFLHVISTIATKCRDFVTRREAIELLDSYPVQEGIWNSWIVSAIAKKFMDMEEEGIPWGAVIPEERRLRVRKMQVVMSERAVKFLCERPMPGTDELEIMAEFSVKW